MNGKRGILAVFLIVAMFFILAAPTLSQATAAIPEYKTAIPQIRVDFNEEIGKIEAVFIKEDSVFQVSGLALPQDDINKKFIISPSINIPNGIYKLQLKAYDIVDNLAVLEYRFRVNATENRFIEMISPNLGTSSSLSFTITIALLQGFNAEKCAYSFVSIPAYPTASTQQFTKENNNRFTISGFTMTQNTKRDFYVICQNAQGQNVLEKFIIAHDNIRPVLTEVKLDPPKVVDEFEPISKLSVTASEEVICKYIINGEERAFPNYDSRNYDAFKRKNEVILSNLADGNTYSLAIFCEDRAGQKSVETARTLIVDFSAPLAITVVKPERFISTATSPIQILTNKRAECEYTFGTGNPTPLTTTTYKNHTGMLTSTGVDGAKTISITCRGEQETPATLTYSFLKDSTPPTELAITMPKAICFLNTLSFEMEGYDNQSGIKKYSYALFGQSIDPLVNWTETTSKTVSISLSQDNIMVEGLSYKIKAKAQNHAGVWSREFVSAELRADTKSIICNDSEKPYINFTLTRNLYNPAITDVMLECVDDVGCDKWSYGYSPNYRECDKSDILSSLITQPVVEINRTMFFCWFAEDLSGKTNSGEFIVKTIKDVEEDISTDSGGTCFDGILNNYETDVDCGGMFCDPCALNSSCLINRDCVSRYCNQTTLLCDIPSCFDGIMNGYETDVDCGGDCEKCELGKKCLTDSDCISGNCYLGVCEVEKPLFEGSARESVYKTSEKPVILLIISLILIFGGGGYLAYKKYFMKKPSKSVQPQMPLQPQARQPVKSARKPFVLQKGRTGSSERLKKILEKRKQSRESLFSKFGGLKETKSEKPSEKEENIFAEEEKEEVLPKKTKPTRKKIDVGEETEYIDLTKKPSVRDIESSKEFKKLDELGLKDKFGKKSDILESKKDSKLSADEIFKKLDELKKKKTGRK